MNRQPKFNCFICDHELTEKSVYAAIETSSLIFKNELKLNLKLGDKRCRFSSKINDCKREGCPYYYE